MSARPAPLRLGVNIDHVATVRQARGTDYPDPLEAALACRAGGADSITAHLREDRRHIQDEDVRELRAHCGLPLNLEMAAVDEMVAIAVELKPAYACLVPERRQELTTEGGLDVAGDVSRLREVCARLAGAGILVSLFIDADPRQLEATLACGAPQIEIHTGRYAELHAADARAAELARIAAFAHAAHAAGLEVHAGHGLNVDNVGAIAAIPEIVELNIGHAIVADALFRGLPSAVDEMRRTMRLAREAGVPDDPRGRHRSAAAGARRGPVGALRRACPAQAPASGRGGAFRPCARAGRCAGARLRRQGSLRQGAGDRLHRRRLQRSRRAAAAERRAVSGVFRASGRGAAPARRPGQPSQPQR
jgi:pyridoxine 5''-phosphate synthase (EC 2.6.99.2)